MRTPDAAASLFRALTYDLGTVLQMLATSAAAPPAPWPATAPTVRASAAPADGRSPPVAATVATSDDSVAPRAGSHAGACDAVAALSPDAPPAIRPGGRTSQEGVLRLEVMRVLQGKIKGSRVYELAEQVAQRRGLSAPDAQRRLHDALKKVLSRYRTTKRKSGTALMVAEGPPGSQVWKLTPAGRDWLVNHPDATEAPNGGD